LLDIDVTRERNLHPLAAITLNSDNLIILERTINKEMYLILSKQANVDDQSLNTGLAAPVVVI